MDGIFRALTFQDKIVPIGKPRFEDWFTNQEWIKQCFWYLAEDLSKKYFPAKLINYLSASICFGGLQQFG